MHCHEPQAGKWVALMVLVMCVTLGVLATLFVSEFGQFEKSFKAEPMPSLPPPPRTPPRPHHEDYDYAVRLSRAGLWLGWGRQTALREIGPSRARRKGTEGKEKGDWASASLPFDLPHTGSPNPPSGHELTGTPP